MAEMNFSHPIVGVHVRRSDKKEDGALYYPLHQYMEHVEEFYGRRTLYGGAAVEKLVYLATDDVSVIEEATRSYPSFRFLTHKAIAQASGDLDARYSKDSLHGVLLDIFMLSRSDFIVCTFSSEMCRLSYELMQARRPIDMSGRIRSIDYIYHYNEQQPQYYRAVLPHTKRTAKEFSMERGDVVRQVLQMVDSLGLMSAVQNTTGFKGFVPNFKLEKVIETAKFF